jgi:hypothetical protein
VEFIKQVFPLQVFSFNS